MQYWPMGTKGSLYLLEAVGQDVEILPEMKETNSSVQSALPNFAKIFGIAILCLAALLPTSASALTWPHPDSVTVVSPAGTWTLTGSNGTYGYESNDQTESASLSGGQLVIDGASASGAYHFEVAVSYSAFIYTIAAANNPDNVALVPTFIVSLSSEPSMGIRFLRDGAEQWEFVKHRGGYDWFKRSFGGLDAMVMWGNSSGGNAYFYREDGTESQYGLYSDYVFYNYTGPLALSILDPADQTTVLRSSGDPSFSYGLRSIWIDGKVYKYQGKYSFAQQCDVFTTSDGLMLSVDSNHLVHGNWTAGSTPVPLTAKEFLGTLLPSQYFNIIYNDNQTAYGFGGLAPPNPFGPVPGNMPPAIRLVVDNEPEIWIWTGRTSGVSRYCKYPFDGSGAPTRWLSLPDGPSVQGTFGGSLSEIGTVNYANGVFQDAPLSMRSVDLDGNLWTAVNIPPAQPAYYVNGTLWIRNGGSGTAVEGTAIYSGSRTGQLLTVSFQSVADGMGGTNVVSTFSFADPVADEGFRAIQGDLIAPSDGLTRFVATNPAPSRWLDIREANNAGMYAQSSVPSWGPPRIQSTEATWTFTHRPVAQYNADIYSKDGDTHMTLWISSGGTVTTDDGTEVAKYNAGRFQSVLPGWTLTPLDVTIPGQGAGHPDVLTINGANWTRGIEGNGGSDVYLGPLSGQRLAINSDGTVSYINPDIGVNQAIEGYFAGNRFYFGTDGLSPTHVMVSGGVTTTGPGGRYSGGAGTTVTNIGNLDVTGNIFSLGTLTNDPTMAGFTMAYGDGLSGAGNSLSMALVRPDSEWTWYHGIGPSGSGNTLQPQMRLDKDNRLLLFKPVVGALPGIVLDPSGSVEFNVDEGGFARVAITQDAFEQSWSGPEDPVDGGIDPIYHSFGGRIEKHQFKLWNHGGEYLDPEEGAGVVNVTNADEVTVSSEGVLIERTTPGETAANVQTTHLTSQSATFGGNVSVKGVLRVPQAGNVSMGGFTNGPLP